MTGPFRTLGLCVALAAFQVPAWARPDELQDTFKSAVEMLERGHKEDALKAIQKVLALTPDQKAAYALWQSTDMTTWRDLLVEGGDFELVAKRLMELARAEIKERKNDKDAIQALVQTATTSTDFLERRKAVRTLSADHGEYATPYLVPFLGGPSNDDRTLLAMHALAQMGTDVVVPITVALNSTNAGLRRNAALVLGNLGDARAAASLQWLAASDADETVKQSARESLAKMSSTAAAAGVAPDALSNFMAAAEAYYLGTDSALRRGEAGEVVWDWKDEHLVGTPIPRELYGSEMSKRACYSALHVDPNSTAALAGLARAYVDLQSKVDRLGAAGVDVGEWKNKAGEALTAVNAAGVDALDMGLAWAVQRADSSTGSALCRVIAPLARGTTAGLAAALKSDDGAIRSEAAVALGQIAARSHAAAAPAVVSTLADAAAREALHIAAVLDGNAQTLDALAGAIRAQGAYVNTWTSAKSALAALRRAAVIDVLVVAESLPDLTTTQVIHDLRGDARLQNMAIVVLTKDRERITEMYGDKIQGTVAGVEDLAAVQAALSKELTGDRALAEDLAGRASAVLDRLAQAGGSDLGPALAALAKATGRADRIALPAVHALGLAGGTNEAGALVAALADDKRSEEVRAAAGRALASLLGRTGTALDAAALGQVQAVVASAAGMNVREAAAQVIGSLPLSPTERAEFVRKLRN